MSENNGAGWRADYAAVEARILARAAVETDLYRSSAAGFYGVPVDQVTPEQRAAEKKRLFAKAYGVRPKPGSPI